MTSKRRELSLQEILDRISPDGKTLDLKYCQIGHSTIIALFSSPQLGKLTHFSLTYSRFDYLGARALADSANLKQLTMLNLHKNNIGAEGARALANSTNLAQLAALDLGYNDIGEAGAIALAASTTLNQLITLNLSQNDIGDRGVKALADSANLRQLTALNLEANEVDYYGARALADSANLKLLTTLSLGGNQIGDGGARLLADSSNLKQLTTLNLGDNGIHLPGARALAKSRNLQQLTTLDLPFNEFGEAGVEALAESENLQHLISLNLKGNRIGDPGARALVGGANLKQLTELNLGSNYLNDEGALALANSANLENLIVLDLIDNQICHSGAEFLLSKNCTFSRSLKSIDLSQNALSLPDEISRDLSELRKHYKIAQKESWHTSRVIKTLVIGVPYVGKTTLVNALTDPDYRLSLERRTQGFNRKKIQLDNISRPDSNGSSQMISLELDVWDFGGHTLQHMIHALFFNASALYLLVFKDFQDSAELSHWIKLIRFSLESDQKALLLPILNSHTPKTLSPTDCYKQLVPFSNYINIAEPVNLRTDKTVSRFENLVDVLDALRIILTQNPLRSVFRVHQEIAEIVALNFSYPAYEYETFLEALHNNETVDKVIKEFNARTDLNESKEELLKNAVAYLDHMGAITVLAPSGSSQRSDAFRGQTGWVIVDPVWVQKGVYALLPPEDNLEVDSAKQELHRQLIQPAEIELLEGDAYPGLFRFEDLRPVFTEFEIEWHQHRRLFEIIQHVHLGLVIPLENEWYFAPAYLEDYGSGNEDDLTEAVMQAYRTAVIIQLYDINDFPSYFLYRHMVSCRSDSEYSHPDFKTINASLQRRHYLLSCQYDERITIEIIQYREWIWCFGQVNEGCSPRSAENALDRLKLDFMDLLDRRGRKDFARRVPCPSCMSNWVNSGFKKNIGTYENKVLKEKRASGDSLQCSVNGLHKDTAEKILENHISATSSPGLVDAAGAIGSGGPVNLTPDYNSYAEYFKAVVHVTMFLYHSGLAEITTTSVNKQQLAESAGVGNLGTVDKSTIQGWWKAGGHGEITNSPKIKRYGEGYLAATDSQPQKKGHTKTGFRDILSICAQFTDIDGRLIVKAAYSLRFHTQDCIDHLKRNHMVMWRKNPSKHLVEATSSDFDYLKDLIGKEKFHQ